MSDIFLSYARNDDEPFVRRLHDALTNAGLSVWFDREKMPNLGLTFSENIKRAVQESRRLALIVGPAALASDYVTKEWQTALSACIPIIPILRQSDYSDLPPELAMMDAPDFRDEAKFDYWLDYLLRQIAEDVPPPGDVYGLRWFQLPRGYILRSKVWAELDQAVRGDAIGAAVATSREQVTALQGMAGLGKSTLAAAYAENCAVRRTFDNGVFWLTAGRAADSLMLMTTLGVLLGDEREEYKNATLAAERLSNLLRNRRALIILDDVWAREAVDAFRSVLGADCRLLFSTRDARIPTLTQAQRVRVETLSIEDGVRVIGRCQNRPLQDDAAERNPYLESERAIVDLLNGHTLAVTLAATRISEVGAGYAPTLLEEYQRARDTANPFDDLELAPDDKNWSIEISLRLSYDALTPDGQIRFKRLGVLAENATFSPETAAAVWATDEAKASLHELETSALIEPESDGRYSQHSVLRAYAAALLRREDAYNSTFWRYVDHITIIAEQFNTYPPEEWRDTIERDIDHIVAVGNGLFVYLANSSDDSDLQRRANDFASSITSYVFRRPQAMQTLEGVRLVGMDWLAMGLETSRRLENQQREALFLYQLGAAWAALGEKHKALEYYEGALPLYREVGNQSDEAATLNNIGIVWADLGEKRQALDYYEQALSIEQVVGNRRSEATSLNNIGLAWADLGENRQALDYYERALSMRRAVGDRGGEAATLNNIGMAWADLGEKHKALDYYEQALLLEQAVGDRRGEAQTLTNIGAVWSSLGEKRKALDYYERALPIRMAVGDRGGEATTLNNIGKVWDDSGEAHKALDYYEQALLLEQAVGDRRGEANTLTNIGTVWSSLGEKRKALDYYERALPIRMAVGDRGGEATTLNNIAAIHFQAGDLQEVADSLRQVIDILHSIEAAAEESLVRYNLAITLSHMEGGTPEAIEQVQQSIALLKQYNLPQDADGNTLAEYEGFLHRLENPDWNSCFLVLALLFACAGASLFSVVGVWVNLGWIAGLVVLVVVVWLWWRFWKWIQT